MLEHELESEVPAASGSFSVLTWGDPQARTDPPSGVEPDRAQLVQLAC